MEKAFNITKIFKRLIKETGYYGPFIELIRERYKTHSPNKALDSVIAQKSHKINGKFPFTSAVDMFTWRTLGSRDAITYKDMDDLFCKAIEFEKEYNLNKIM